MRPKALFILPILFVWVMLTGGYAMALTADSALDNPADEARAKQLFAEFRCMVCEGQSIADSNADLAHDMRMLVRERIKQGDSNAQVKSYLVERYGEYILFAPPMKLSTSFLWLGPFLLLLVGGGIVVMIIRKNTSGIAEDNT